MLEPSASRPGGEERPCARPASGTLSTRASVADSTSRDRRLAVEHAVAAALELSSDLAGVAPSFVQAVCAPLGWACGACWIEPSPGAALECVGVWGAGGSEIEAFLAATRAMQWGTTPAGPSHACRTNGSPVWGAVVGARASLAAAAGIHGAFALPVIAEGHVIGVVELFGAASEEPDGPLFDWARFIGSQFGAFCRRTRAQAQAREDARPFVDTVELAALGIAHVVAGGRFSYVNRWFCDMLGYTREELLARTVKQVSHPDDKNVTDDVRARMRSGEIPFFDMEKRYVHKDGTTVWVALRISLQRDAAGQPLHDIATFQDISARRQAEHALASRERSMRLVLDNTGDGLVSATLDGIVDAEVSRAAREWLGAPVSGQKLDDYLFPDDPAGAAAFAFGFEQLAEDILPFDVAASQMPARKQHGANVLALEYKQILEGEKFIGVLTVLRNITMQLKAERRDAEAREVHNMVGHILRSSQGFRTFLEESGRLLEIIRCECDPVIVKRALHTMKGNCAVYGIESVAKVCHAVEERLGAGEVAPDDVDLLHESWQRALDRVGAHVDKDSAHVDLDSEDIARLKEKLHARADYCEILDIVHTWGAEPVSAILERLSAQATRIAAGLGKEVEVEVTVDADAGRAAPEMGPFWSSLVHVIRNAIDHGIELPDDREEKGKSRAGRLRLSVARGPGRAMEVEVVDDGAGIDLRKLEERARALGVPFTNEGELLQAVFVDGLTTRDAVTELSGRGSGLGAVRGECEALGGKVNVRSSAAGTTFTFAFALVTSP